MTPQPDVTLSGVVVGSQIVASLSPKGYARQITRLSIVGPSPSTFAVYVGMINSSCRKLITTRGDANDANLDNPVPIPAGLLTYFVWTAWTVSVASTVTIGYDRL